MIPALVAQSTELRVEKVENFATMAMRSPLSMADSVKMKAAATMSSTAR